MNIIDFLKSGFDINQSLRLEKAIEIKNNFKRIFKQNMNCFVELKLLEKYINLWVKNDEHFSGNIYVKDINKYIIYQLNYLEHTFVKISNELPK